jgi:COP9 signalosome complex subunit 8
MPQAPPTPPPTSATELADQARLNAALAVDVTVDSEAAPAPEPAPATSQSAPDVHLYLSLVPTLTEFASRLDYRGLIRTTEKADLQVAMYSSEYLGLGSHLPHRQKAMLYLLDY